jgi:hypothetical protein
MLIGIDCLEEERRVDQPDEGHQLEASSE